MRVFPFICISQVKKRMDGEIWNTSILFWGVCVWVWGLGVYWCHMDEEAIDCCYIQFFLFFFFLSGTKIFYLFDLLN